MEKNKKNIVLLLALFIVGVVVGLLIGYGIFSEKAPGPSGSNYKDLIDIAFPRPPEDLRTVTGLITKIDSSKIEIKISDPDDYLPHKDGSAQATLSRTVNITDKTEMTVFFPTQIDKSGNIKKEAIKISDLKTGEMITVTAQENIRKATEINALLVEKIQY